MHVKKLKWLSLFPLPHFGLFSRELVNSWGGGGEAFVAYRGVPVLDLRFMKG